MANPVRIRAGDWPADVMAEESLIDSTGSTQGITFRINPPRNAMAAIHANSPMPGTTAAMLKGGSGGASESAGCKVAARLPSVTVICNSGKSGAAARTGSLAQTSLSPCPKRTSGFPNAVPSPSSGKISGASNGTSLRAVTVRAVIDASR